MAKYGNFPYGGAKYGVTPKLGYSVAPMDVVVLDFTKAYVSWQSPAGAFTRIRLLRNQNGFSAHSEDGIIVWEEYATEGNVTRSSILDGEDNLGVVSIYSGKPVYYTMLLFTDQKIWVNAGIASDIVPSNHNAQQKIMNYIPKVYTSSIQSPLGVVDETSALYNFIDGLSFTYEQLLTEIDLLRPRHSRDSSSHLLIPVETDNVGLTREPSLDVRNQKRLVREAFFMYAHKGLKVGLDTYVESVTSYAPITTVSNNLLLSPQDSTFYNSLGNWVVTNATAEISTAQVAAAGDNVIDSEYTCKLTATDSFSMVLGNVSPITHGIPVKENTDYIASAKVKSPPSDGDTSITIHWYDNKGEYISSDFGSSVATNNTWKTASSSATSPAGATYVALEISSNADGQYYIDQVCMQLGVEVAYDEARAVSIFLEPNRTNYVKNPSFEVNVTDSWTIDGSASVTQDVDVSAIAYAGVNSAKITASGPWTFTSNSFAVTPGVYGVVSAFVKTTNDLTMTLVGRDSNGNVVDTTDIYDFGTVVDWARVSGVELIDAFNTGLATYEIEFSGNAGVFYLDCVQAEYGVTPSEYFDGSLPSQYGVVWEGTADNSYSHLYYNKPYKIPRIGQTIYDWVPPNTFWRLKTYGGLEYTNLTV